MNCLVHLGGALGSGVDMMDGLDKVDMQNLTRDDFAGKPELPG